MLCFNASHICSFYWHSDVTRGQSEKKMSFFLNNRDSVWWPVICWQLMMKIQTVVFHTANAGQKCTSIIVECRGSSSFRWVQLSLPSEPKRAFWTSQISAVHCLSRERANSVSKYAPQTLQQPLYSKHKTNRVLFCIEWSFRVVWHKTSSPQHWETD